jgi:hypothetical protein
MVNGMPLQCPENVAIDPPRSPPGIIVIVPTIAGPTNFWSGPGGGGFPAKPMGVAININENNKTLINNIFFIVSFLLFGFYRIKFTLYFESITYNLKPLTSNLKLF